MSNKTGEAYYNRNCWFGWSWISRQIAFIKWSIIIVFPRKWCVISTSHHASHVNTRKL